MSKKKIIAIVTIIVLLFAAGISVGVFLHGRGETEAADGSQTQTSDQNQETDGNQATGEIQTGNNPTTDTQNPDEQETTTPGENVDAGTGNNETVEDEDANNNNANNQGNAGNNAGVTTDTNIDNVGETTITRVEEQERLVSEAFLDWWKPMSVAVTQTDIGVQVPQITVKKAAITGVGGDKFIYAGQDITYVIAVTNNSETDVENIEVTDKIPQNTTFVSIDDAFILRNIEEELSSEVVGTKTTVGTDVIAGVKWVVSIPAGETVIVSFTVNVNENITGTILNTAIANGEESNDGEPTKTAVIKTNKSSIITRNNEKVETAKIGDLITYTITVENTGDVEGTTYITDTVPEGTKFVSAQEGAIVSEAQDSVIWSVTVPAGEIVTREFSVEVISIDGAITNIANVGGTDTEPDTTETAGIIVNKEVISIEREGEEIENSEPVKDGDIIKYTITVTNIGSKDLTNVVVDEKLDGIDLDETELNIEKLEAGASKVINATYTVTYDVDIKNREDRTILNEVYVSGETIPENPEQEPEKVEDEDEVITTVEETPLFTTTKTADKEKVTTAGEVITYTITVTNTGNTTITVPVVDKMINVDTTLVVPVGESREATGTYTVTQDDIDNGVAIKNVATVGYKTPEVEVTVEQKPGYTATKTADKAKVVAAGEVITYTITVTNTGNTTITVPVVDEMINVDTTLVVPVGESREATGTYTVTQDDIDNGVAIKNVATVGDKTPEVEVPVEQKPGYTATKTADKEKVVAAGEVITYTITVTNTGNTTITVPVVDKMINVDTTLVVPVGESKTATGTYTVTQADMDKGAAIKNVATVGDKTPEIEVPVEQKPGYTASKTADKEKVIEAGEVITYTITVTNTGNTTVTVPVVDKMIGIDTEVTVPVGESKTATGTYTVSQEEIDNGAAIKNVATVGDKTPEVEVAVEQNPGYTASKTADKEKVIEAGEVITYTITVTNTGNTTVTVPVVDKMINVDTTLVVPVGESRETTGTYTVTQDDIDNGVAIKNVATVGYKTPEVEVPVEQKPGYTATKTADKEKVVAAGEVITYTITVTNTGNTTITVPVVDEMINVDTTLVVPVGESRETTGTYAVTQDDIDNGVAIKNVATVGDKTPEVEVPVEQKPGYTASKTADKEKVVAAGEVITYTITVTNTGNTTVTVPVVDKMINVDTEVTLSVGESKTVTGTYTVTQDDIDNGAAIKNIATVGDKNPEVEVPVEQKPGYTATKNADKEKVVAAGEVITYTITVTNTGNTTITVPVVDEMINVDTTLVVPVGESRETTGTYTVTQDDIDNGVAIKNVATVGDKTPEIEVPVEQKPGYTASKTADKEKVVAAGEVITYTITVTNTGNTTITVPVVDKMINVDTEVTLSVGESKTVTGTYTVTQADMDKGAAIKNVATVGDKTPEVEVPVEQKPGYTASKTADKEKVVAAGEVITYTITVTNTGNTTITVPVVDKMINVDTEVTLSVGESKTVTGTYTVTQADMDKGAAIKNVATVGDKEPEIEVPVEQKPGYTASKIADKEKVVAAGEVITYTITVTNTGNTTITVPVVDKMINVDTEVTLSVGESKTVTGTYAVTQDDIDNGVAIKNVATVGDKTPEVEVAVEQKPGYTASKTADKAKVVAAGEVITYTITVTNTGNTTVTVPVVDKMIGIDTEVTVPVGQSKTVTGTYTVSQEEIDKGVAIKNVATVGDKTPEIEVPVEQNPGYTASKTADKEKVIEAGEVITYTITVTNTGNTTVTVPVVDKMINVDTTLVVPVGESREATGTYIVTQDDIDNGVAIKNVATVGDKEPEVEVRVEQKPGYTATKTADKEKVVAAGEVITYTITVTNTGNTTVKVPVVDKMINVDEEVTLSVGESKTVTGTYTVTQADIDNGTAIKNVATVGDKTPEIEVPVEQKPGYTASKTADKAKVVAAGEVITYTITVTNTGNTTITVPVVDKMINVDTEVTVPVGQSKTVTGTYTVTQADIDKGTAIKNVATVGDKTPEVEVPVEQNPGYTASKTADKAKVVAAGEVITYTITVTNTGNTTITVPVVDKMIGVDTEVTVPVGQSKTVTGTYTVTQADIDNGATIKNVATVGDKTPEVEVPVEQKPGFETNKTAALTKKEGNTSDKAEVGDIITYTITVTNTGNITLENIVITDPMLSINEAKTIQIGSTETITKQHTVTSQDIEKASKNNGQIINVATAKYGEITDSDDATTEIRMQYSYTVEYYYEHTEGTISFEGKLFVNDSSKTEEIRAEYGDKITEYTDNNISGYELMKAVTTDSDGKLPLVVTEVTENNVIKVYYIKKTYNYKVEHYLQNLDGTWPSTPKDTDSITNVTFGEKATYEINSYTGFSYDATKTINGNATVPANNDLVIKLYYVRNQYNYEVNYLEYGTNEVLHTQKVVNNIPFGTTITSADEVISITGYNYHSVNKSNLIIGAGSNVINIYYTENVRTAAIVEKSTSIRKTNLVLVLDLSSSMENGTTRLADAKAAANKFIDQIYNSQGITGINIKVVTFNSRSPIIEKTECSRYDNSDHYEKVGMGIWKHKSNGDSNEYDGCTKVDGTWYSSYGTAAYSGTQVLSTTLTNNTATNYAEAQTLKNAISAIYIPDAYKKGNYGTHIYAALQEANTQITSLKTAYPNNDNVVVFLGDGKPTETHYTGYEDNTDVNITSAATALKGKATVYCIRLGNEAQNSTVFRTIATSSNNILDANTQGDLINGFNAITSNESTRNDTASSSKGIITIVADLDTAKSIVVTKPDGTSGTYNSITELNASGFISYNTENKTFTWNVLNYPSGVELSISYSVK